jgi:transposase
MLTAEVWMEIKVLQGQGHSIRAIAEMTGHSRNTVRRQLRKRESPRFQKPPRASKLDPFKSYIQQRYEQCRLSGVRLHEEIKAMGYDGKPWAMTARWMWCSGSCARSSPTKPFTPS